MSTEELNFDAEGMDVEKLLGALGKSVPAARATFEERLKGQDTRRNNVALGASAIIQRSLDDDEKTKEQRDQMDAIIARAQAMLNQAAPAPAPAPQAPVEPSVVTPAPAPEPQAPVHQTTVIPVVAPQPAPSAPAYSVVRPEDTSDLLWRIVGGVLFFVLGMVTRDWPQHDLHGDALTVFAIAWVIALTCLGWFSFGWVGWRMRHGRRQ